MNKINLIGTQEHNLGKIIDTSFKNTLHIEVPAKYPEIDSPHVDIADDSIEISRFEIKKSAEAQE